VDQQKRMRQSFVDFANHISSTALDINATWPLYRIPRFELHAGQFRLETGVEYVYCNYLVDLKDADDYLEFVSENYVDSTMESHLTRYGNLGRLNATGFIPSFRVFGPNGTVPDNVTDRPIRSALWQISPRKFQLYNVNMPIFQFDFNTFNTNHNNSITLFHSKPCPTIEISMPIQIQFLSMLG
jgi:hypothetical protein